MADLEENMRRVAQGLGHQFSDASLLVDALTHSSFANEKPKLARTDNELLEFMGDAVLQWVVSSLLLERYPEATAGEMTRRRADLVCEEGLSEIALSIELGEGLRLGKGEERTGGRDKPRLLASAFEACVAAVYLDSSADHVVTICRGLFQDRIGHRDPGSRDYKTRAQEALQSRGLPAPRYELVSATGPDHERSFTVTFTCDGKTLGEGQGRSKLEAEQRAASQALDGLTDSSE